MNTYSDFGVGQGPAGHLKRAAVFLIQWAQMSAFLQKTRAQRLSWRLAATAVLALFAIVWGELAAYFALKGIMAQGWAALIVLFANGFLIAGVNLIGRHSRTESKVEAIAESSKQEAAYELLAAKNELLGLKQTIQSSTQALVHERVVVPYQRYKVPVALGATFFTGLYVARALFSDNEKRRSHPRY